MDTLSKKGLRAKIRARRSALAQSALGRQYCIDMQKNLLASDLWAQCENAVLYVSAKGEPDTSLLLQNAWESRRTVFLPRCVPDSPGLMDMVACTKETALETSPFGIQEPPLSAQSRLLTAKELHMGAKTLVVIPALAFDRQGFRLGYGGGYYDRMLARADCLLVGLAFDELFLDSLPHDTWDIPADFVCTEKNLYAILK